MTEPNTQDPTGYFREVIVEMTAIPLAQVREHIEQRLGEVEAKLEDLDTRTAANNRKTDRALTASDKAAMQLSEMVDGLGGLGIRASAIDERLAAMEQAIGALEDLLDLGDGRGLGSVVAQVEADRASVGSSLTSIQSTLVETNNGARTQSDRLQQLDTRMIETETSIRGSRDSVAALAGDLERVRQELSPLGRIEGVEKAVALTNDVQRDSAAAISTLFTQLENRNQTRERTTQILLAAVIVLIVIVAVLQAFGR